MQRKIYSSVRSYFSRRRRPIRRVLKFALNGLSDYLILKITSLDRNYIFILLPPVFAKILHRINPRLASVFFTIYNKHSSQKYYYWNHFNSAVRNNVCTPLIAGCPIRIADFKFYVGACKMPITMLLLLQVYEHMSLEQRNIFSKHYESLMFQISKKNQNLYVKQLLYLLIKHDVCISTVQEFVGIVKQINLDFDCEIFTNFVNCSLKSQLDDPVFFENVVIKNSSFFTSNGLIYLIDTANDVSDTNFFYRNIFLAKDSSFFIHFEHKNVPTKNNQYLDSAKLLLTQTHANDKYKLLKMLLGAISDEKNKLFPVALIASFNPGDSMLSYLSKIFDFNLYSMDAGDCLVKNLEIYSGSENTTAKCFEKIKETALSEGGSKYDFSNKVILLTNSFSSLDETALIKLATTIKQTGGSFLDINLATFEELIDVFLHAKTLICGNHSILALLSLRPTKYRTILLYADNESLDKLKSEFESVRLDLVNLKSLSPVVINSSKLGANEHT